MKKTMSCALIVLAFSACGQNRKQEIQGDNMNVITIYEIPEIMSDTLRYDLSTPSESEKNDTIVDKSYDVHLTAATGQIEFMVDNVPPSLNLYWGEITKPEGRSISPTVPLNSCILKSGRYEVTGRIYPRYGQTALEFYSYLMLEGYYREAGNWEKKFPMFTIETPGTEGAGNKGLDGYPYFELRTEIDVEVPYEVEGWSNSVNLKEEDKDDLKNELLERYNTIREMVAENDTSAFKKLIWEREELLATVFYLEESEKKSRLQKLTDVIGDENYELAPYPENVQMFFFAEGRMVTLVDTINRDGIIRLINKNSPKDTVSLEFRFHRKNETLIVI
ncbi:hypothetical protein [Sinomicrobium soli]|uniref:hypothetical protein n=1 Tax=Sinomicrobium sp. N-1-3-6 TaxID=2219864 RepID=UPI000DCCDA16|nr:hypothetical protein [Sinomicrobium sp. N-1-3-6]RAV30757.1 hypothetical protein DN748_00415 [Sinomicrobium sp. N-1-3-6]